METRTYRNRRFPRLTTEITGDRYAFHWDGGYVETYRITADGYAEVHCSDRRNFPPEVSAYVLQLVKAEHAKKKAAVSPAASTESLGRAS